MKFHKPEIIIKKKLMSNLSAIAPLLINLPGAGRKVWYIICR